MELVKAEGRHQRGQILCLGVNNFMESIQENCRAWNALLHQPRLCQLNTSLHFTAQENACFLLKHPLCHQLELILSFPISSYPITSPLELHLLHISAKCQSAKNQNHPSDEAKVDNKCHYQRINFWNAQMHRKCLPQILLIYVFCSTRD
jgi:hypothetical protein